MKRSSNLPLFAMARNNDSGLMALLSMSMSIVVYVAHNRKVSNALCTLAKREKKSFQVLLSMLLLKFLHVMLTIHCRQIQYLSANVHIKFNFLNCVVKNHSMLLIFGLQNSEEICGLLTCLT